MAPRQPPPDVLDVPPPGRPFGIVTQDPLLKTPAGKAGLSLGDALFSFGTAKHLRDVQSVLTSSVGKPVPVVCVAADGRTFRKYVIPAQWDPAAPKSLLGCQMSNQCPIDHPAVSRRGTRTAGVHPAAGTLGPPAKTCWPRVALVLVSLLQVCLALSIVGLPSVLPGASDLLRLTKLDTCSAPGSAGRRLLGSNDTVAAASVAGAADAATSTTEVAAVAAAITSLRAAHNSTASDLHDQHVPAATVSHGPVVRHAASAPFNATAMQPLSPSSSAAVAMASAAAASSAAPTLTARGEAEDKGQMPTPPEHSKPKPHKESADKEPHGGGKSNENRVPQQRIAAEAPSSPSSPASLPASISSAAPARTAGTAASPPSASTASTTSPSSNLAGGTAAFSNSGLGLLTIGHVDPSAPANVHLLSSLQLDGQFDMDDLVLGVFIACCVLVVIALLGLAIACSRPYSCVRTAVCLLYYVTSLPAAVALGFAVTFCLAFRSEAEQIVRRYWLCLLLTEPQHMNGAARTAWGAAAAVYQSVTLAAMMLLACVVLLLAGLYAASRVIGPGVIAHHMLNVINCGQLLVGAGLCAVAAGLHARADGSVHADAALLVLGASVLAMSSLGLLASRAGASCPCLLRLYGVLAMLTTAGLVSFVGGLSFLGVKGISDSSFLESNWHYVRQVYPLSKEAFTQLLRNHWSKLLIAGSLLTIVQLLVLTATCVLRRALLRGGGGGKERATASERAGLIADADEGGDFD